ncbi:MAG: TetR family transcriptional regulator, partial [Gammaproteobacteria bacterium]
MNDSRLNPKHIEVIQNFENLLEQGIANQTMSDIASSLKVSLRTLYEIAPSKEKLVISTIDRILTNIAKQALTSLKNMDSSVGKLRTFT